MDGARFLPLLTLFAVCVVIYHFSGMPRKRLWIMAASPVVGAALGLLFALMTDGGQLTDSRWLAACVFNGACGAACVAVGWLAIPHLRWRHVLHRQLRESVAQGSEFRACPVQVFGPTITSRLDELSRTTAIKLLPCRPRPEDQPLSYEDWTDVLADGQDDGTHLIVPLTSRPVVERDETTGLAHLWPRNPFNVVLMRYDAQRDLAEFSPSSDSPFCARVMDALQDPS